MQIQISDDYEAMSRLAANRIVAELKLNPALVLCVSAGNTPTRTYQLLAKAAHNRPGLVKKLRVLQIDEWLGVRSGSGATCREDIQSKLLKPLGIGRGQFAAFHSESRDAVRECSRVTRWLARNGPIDLCILGLGINGHIAMNEPGTVFSPGIHVAKLALSSRKHPLLQQVNPKPAYGLTLGLREILCSRQILLLVSGPGKARALSQLTQPSIRLSFPASFLWLHPNAYVLCDKAAAGSLRQRAAAGNFSKNRIVRRLG